MIYELKPDNFYKVKEFFNFAWNSRAHYAITGYLKGRVFVDNPDTPQTVAVNMDCDYYIDGDHTNENFIWEIFEKVRQEGIWPNHDVAGFIFPDDQLWSNSLAKNFKESIVYCKNSYTLDRVTFDWQANMPSDMFLKEIDEEILLSGKYKNLEAIEGFIRNYTLSTEHFLSQKRGYCLVKGDEIVCSAPFYYDANNNSYGLDIETVESYRNRGLATIFAAAVSQICLDRGSTMTWECWDDLTSSSRVAEKIGHKLVRKYKLHLHFFDDYVHHYCLYERYKDNEANYQLALKYLDDSYELRDKTDSKYLKKLEWPTHAYSTYYYNRYSLLLKMGQTKEAQVMLSQVLELVKNDQEQADNLKSVAGLEADDLVNFLEEKYSVMEK